MIAVRALPGAPYYTGNNDEIVNAAKRDLDIYKSAGVDAIVLENDWDLPYIKPPLPDEALLLMERIAHIVRQRFDGPIGIQLLEAANEDALTIAANANLDFVRVEAYIFAHVGSAGIIEGCAGKLHRLRSQRGVEHIRLFADLKKKHCSHALTADLSIVDELHQAEFFAASGTIITGKATGIEPDLLELKQVKAEAKKPVLIGSGMTSENIGKFYPHADGFIVGSDFRTDGRFLANTESDRVQRFVQSFRRAKMA